MKKEVHPVFLSKMQTKGCKRFQIGL